MCGITAIIQDFDKLTDQQKRDLTKWVTQRKADLGRRLEGVELGQRLAAADMDLKVLKHSLRKRRSAEVHKLKSV
jgi:hypothetical protein